MIPHTIAPPAIENLFEFDDAPLGRVLRQRPRARARRHLAQFGLRPLECRDRLGGGRRDENLATRLEEGVEALPPVAQYRRAAGGGLEEASRRAVADVGHRP